MYIKAFGRQPSGPRLERIKRSPHYREDHFQNLAETSLIAKDASYIRMTLEFFSKGKDREPTRDIPSVKTNLKQLPASPSIIWFGHSSYLLHYGEKNILVDPVFSKRASPVPFAGSKSYPGTSAYSAKDLPDIDVLLITHDHYDHLDYNTIVTLKEKVKQFITPLGVGAHLSHWGIADEKIVELDWWEHVPLFHDTSITATPARHFSGRGLVRNKTLWTSYVLTTPDHKLFIGGDSGYDSTFKTIGEKFGPFDVAILECGQYDLQWPQIHMMPEETVQAAMDLKARVLMPVHWGKFTLALHAWHDPIERALKHARQLGVTVTTPRIGEPVILGNTLPASPWWNT
jgi:L-ascorbate metabolism protein UlaG (beta-lactamase superfamily)